MTPGRGTARIVLVPLVAASALCVVAGADASSLDARMVAEQVEARGIEDARVLDALRRVPRAAFVPPEVRWRAHEDTPLSIGHGQTISQPYIVALMTSLLDVGPGEKVLEIGTGSGYQAAVLSHLARQVYTVEIVPELAAEARLRLTRQGLWNIHVRQGDGNFGWEDYGPYDRIMVTAAAPKVPEALVAQLAEGGVLVMPLGAPDAVQVLVRGVKRSGKLYAHPVRKVRFVPLTGAVERGRTPLSYDPAAPSFSGRVLGRCVGTARPPVLALRSDTPAPRGGRSRAGFGPAARDVGRRRGSGARVRGAAHCAPAVG